MNSKPNITAFWAAVIALGLMAVTIFAAGWYGAIQTVDAPKPPEVTTATIERIRPIIRQEIERSRDTTPAWVPHVERPLRERLLVWKDVSRGGNYIARLDAALEGSPLAGRGREFYIAAVDAGIEPRLSVAIAMRESRLGRAIPSGSFNAWGMTKGTAPGYGAVAARGPDGVRGYQAFPDWSTAIREHARFIRRTWGPVASAYQMHGYAEDGAWAGAVESVRASI